MPDNRDRADVPSGDALRQALKAANSWEALVSVVRTISPDDLDASTVSAIHRALAGLEGASDLRVAYLSDQTLDPLARHVDVHGAIQGVRIGSLVGPYEQHFQQVLDPGSPLMRFDPHAIVLLLSLEAVAPALAGGLLNVSPEQRRAAVGEAVEAVQGWVRVATERTDATLVIANFPRPPHAAAGPADGTLEFGEAEFFAELNLALLRALRPDPRVSVLDLDHALARSGRERALNPQMAYLARIPWHDAALPAVATDLLRHLRCIRAAARKCLVLDLDNTLWGGVLGEEGVWGVKVGSSDAVGRAYADFQRAAKALMHAGVVLAICSKNNRDDVLELFASRPDMPLQLEDFASTRIDWEPKHENLRHIATELNIGIDSLVFVDDNPVECAAVRAMLPEVETLLLADDPAERPGMLRRLTAFDRLRITAEDSAKTAQYRDNAARTASFTRVGDLNAFLEDLATRVVIEPADGPQVPRIQQLFAKTNQFNVTTRRYAIADVEAMIADPDCMLRVATVSDRFGELGLVGVCLVRVDGDRARIDSLLMSCRAMGRGIETAFMNTIKDEVFRIRGVQFLEADFVPTRKNMPVQDFFDNQGFQCVTVHADGARHYGLEASAAAPLECPGITVERRWGAQAECSRTN